LNTTTTQQNNRQLRESFDYCEALTKKRARNFYYGIRLTPKPKRGAMYAIYAWTRIADDLADDAPNTDKARANLDTFRNLTLSAIDKSFSSSSSSSSSSSLASSPAQNEFNSPIWPAFIHSVNRFNINPSDLIAMIEGQLDDLTTTTRTTFDDLYRYCNRVASTVGRMCLAVWGYRHDSDALQLAEYRGVALQLTNILRDLVEDATRGRSYLPDEDFNRFNLILPNLLEWNDPETCDAFLRFQIDRARNYYHQSKQLESLISQDCVSTSYAFMLVYRKLLDQIAADPKAVIRDRGGVRLSRLAKMKTAAAAIRKAHKNKRQSQTRIINQDDRP